MRMGSRYEHKATSPFDGGAGQARRFESTRIAYGLETGDTDLAFAVRRFNIRVADGGTHAYLPGWSVWLG